MPSSKPDPESSRRAELEKLKRQSKEHLDMIEEALKRTRPIVGGERKTDGSPSDAPDGGGPGGDAPPKGRPKS